MTETKEVYSEVYSVLEMLGSFYIDKLPKKLMSFIDNERDKNFNPTYDINNFENQDISKQALSFIAMLHLNYWCDNEEEQNKLKEVFEENEIKEQKELLEKYDPDNLFKNKVKSVEKQNIENNQKTDTQLVEYNESIFKKIINIIKNFLKRNK